METLILSEGNFILYLQILVSIVSGSIVACISVILTNIYNKKCEYSALVDAINFEVKLINKQLVKLSEYYNGLLSHNYSEESVLLLNQRCPSFFTYEYFIQNGFLRMISPIYKGAQISYLYDCLKELDSQLQFFRNYLSVNGQLMTNSDESSIIIKTILGPLDLALLASKDLKLDPNYPLFMKFINYIRKRKENRLLKKVAKGEKI